MFHLFFKDDEHVLRSLALLRIGQLFMDANFPPLESSLYYSHRLVEGRVTWMRPHVSTDQKYHKKVQKDFVKFYNKVEK